MPTAFDLIYVALFSIVIPVWDYAVLWRTFDEAKLTDPAGQRRRFWINAIVWPWFTVAAGIALWLYYNRPWSSLSLDLPVGWRLWCSVILISGLVAYLVSAARSVAQDPRARQSVLDQLTGKVADVMPHTRAEMNLFTAVSITAGFCEEFLFRGFFIWALTPWLGWWGAAALSLAVFAGWHAYQGWQGVVRTGIAGLILTASLVVFSSVWPGIVLHAILDIGMGAIAYLALRDNSADTSLAEGT